MVARSLAVVPNLCLFQFLILKSETVPHLKAAVEFRVENMNILIFILCLCPSRIWLSLIAQPILLLDRRFTFTDAAPSNGIICVSQEQKLSSNQMIQDQFQQKQSWRKNVRQLHCLHRRCNAQFGVFVLLKFSWCTANFFTFHDLWNGSFRSIFIEYCILRIAMR